MNAEMRRVQWACRRGMLELDLMLLPFFSQQYPALKREQQLAFQGLLQESDQDIHALLTGNQRHEQPAIQQLVETLRAFFQTVY